MKKKQLVALGLKNKIFCSYLGNRNVLHIEGVLVGKKTYKQDIPLKTFEKDNLQPGNEASFKSLLRPDRKRLKDASKLQAPEKKKDRKEE